MNIEVAIVGHVRRTDMVMSLMSKVDPTYVMIDDGTRGCFLNHRRAWQAIANGGTPTWGVVLEDDAVPVMCFRDQLEQALAAAPSPVVSLYLGRDRPRFIQPVVRRVIEQGVEECWLTTNHMLHAVGIAIRGDLITSMLKHIEAVPAALLPIDRAIGHWVAESLRGTVSYTWPSLVDHANLESVIDVHPDGEPRGRVLYLDDGQPIPVMSPRVAWNVGVRDRWNDSSHVLA